VLVVNVSKSHIALVSLLAPADFAASAHVAATRAAAEVIAILYSSSSFVPLSPYC
jgi:hypothetical protein